MSGKSEPQLQTETEIPRFQSLFASNRSAYTIGRHTGRTKPTPHGLKQIWNYATVRRAFSDCDVTAHIQGLFSIVAIPIRENGTCSWGVIDIDVYSPDAELELRAADVDVPVYVFRSKSGGFHLFVFFSEPRPAALVRQLLRKLAADLGFPGAEIFPKQDHLDDTTQCGNGINLPFFGDAAGFAEFEPERYAIPTEGWKLASVETPALRLNDETGFWRMEALAARLNAWRQFIPGFSFRLGRGGRFEVPCPGNLEFGWMDGAKHESHERLLSPVTQVWVYNGWPVFKCFHAHCDGGCGSPKKTWKDFQEFFDPGRLFHRFDEWVEEKLVEQQGGEFRCSLR